MTQVRVDAAVGAMLTAGEPQVEVVDEAGAPIGRFVRYTRHGEYLIEGDLPTDAELDEQVRNAKWHTAEEMNAFVRKLREAFP